MKSNNRNKQDDKQPVNGKREESRNRREGRESFEGMNFEQQRGSYKNSDGAGVSGREMNGQHAPE